MEADIVTPNDDDNSNNNKATINVNDKLAILKKAVLDERKQKEAIQKELQLYQETINEKNLHISKLQMQLDTFAQSLNDVASKNSGSANDADVVSNEQEILQLITEMSRLKEELTQCKEESKSYQEQNLFLKQQLEALSTEIDVLRSKNETTENTLTARINALISESEAQKQKLNVLQNLNKDLELKQYSYESTISSLQKEMKQKENELIALSQTNEALILAMQTFKQDIEIKSREYKQLQLEFDRKREITVNEVFKGKLLLINGEKINKSKNRFEMFYGKYPEAVVMTFANSEKIVKINDIYSIKHITKDEDGEDGDKTSNSDDNNIYKTLEIYFMNNSTEGALGEELVLVVQFKERECEYIITFYKERSKKHNKIAYTDLFS